MRCSTRVFEPERGALQRTVYSRDYLDGLYVILHHPIECYPENDLQRLKSELLTLGVKFITTDWLVCHMIPRKVIVADHASIRERARLSRKFGCRVIGILDLERFTSTCRETNAARTADFNRHVEVNHPEFLNPNWYEDASIYGSGIREIIPTRRDVISRESQIYFHGLRVVLVEPIYVYSRIEVEQIKAELTNRGAVVESQHNPDGREFRHNVIVIDRMLLQRDLLRAVENANIQNFQAVIIDIVYFLKSLKLIFFS